MVNVLPLASTLDLFRYSSWKVWAMPWNATLSLGKYTLIDFRKDLAICTKSRRDR
jgi:hypothetical protein